MSDKNYKASVKSVGKMNAERVMKRWGAGWELLSSTQKQNAVAMECLMGIFGSVDETVEVQIARDIFNASCKFAHVEEQDENEEVINAVGAVAKEG